MLGGECVHVYLSRIEAEYAVECELARLDVDRIRLQVQLRASEVSGSVRCRYNSIDYSP